MKKNNKYTKEQMYALIRKWEDSGLSQEQFFLQHGIAKSTFGFWRKKYLKETGSAKSKENFIPVKISSLVPAGSNTGTIEIVYPNGVHLICPVGIDPSRIKPLIAL